MVKPQRPNEICPLYNTLGAVGGYPKFRVRNLDGPLYQEGLTGMCVVSSRYESCEVVFSYILITHSTKQMQLTVTD